MSTNNRKRHMQDEMSSTIAESARTSTNIFQPGYLTSTLMTRGNISTPSNQPSKYDESKKVIAAPAKIEHKPDEFDDVDDDVTRALLAAAAGVTYSNREKNHDSNRKSKSSSNSSRQPLENKPTIEAAPAPPSSVKPVAQVPVQPAYLTPMPNLNQPPPMIPATTSVASSTMSIDFAKLQAKNSTKVEEDYPTKKNKKFLRIAAGKVWNDESLNEWDPNDFRIFCGDLGPEVTDETLVKTFNRYSSFKKARVVRDKRSNKSKGYGFVSFDDPEDFTRAMREVNGKYVGSRPIKLRRSDWKSRLLDTHKKKEKEKKKLGMIL